MKNKQFEEWLKPVIQDNIALPNETVTFEDVQAFYEYPLSMQYGVYLEFLIWLDNENHKKGIGSHKYIRCVAFVNDKNPKTPEELIEAQNAAVAQEFKTL